MSGYYNIGRSKKWWKRVFSYIVECCILKSYVLESHIQAASHQVRGSGKRDFLAFRLYLARQLVGSYCSRQQRSRPRLVSPDRLDRLNIKLGHWICCVQTKRRCVVCLAMGKKLGVTIRHETHFECHYCKVPLCATLKRDCFFRYHTMQFYLIVFSQLKEMCILVVYNL